MDDFLVRLIQMQDQLPPAQQKAVSYLLQHKQEMSGLSINEVAHASGVSSATLVRLGKLLGYKGFKEFSLALSISAATTQVERIAYADIQPGDNLHTIISHVTQHNQTAISDTISVMNEDDIEKVVQMIHQSRRVDFYGVGMSALVAQDAQMKFQRLGKVTQGSLDPHMQAVTAASLMPGDTAILFSYSGETGDILDTMAAVQRAGAFMVSVTCVGKNRLSRQADISLYVAASEMLVRSAAMSSRISMMHLIDILFSAVAARGYEQYKPFLDRTHLEGRIKRRSLHRNSKDGDLV